MSYRDHITHTGPCLALAQARRRRPPPAHGQHAEQQPRGGARRVELGANLELAVRDLHVDDALHVERFVLYASSSEGEVIDVQYLPQARGSVCARAGESAGVARRWKLARAHLSRLARLKYVHRASLSLNHAVFFGLIISSSRRHQGGVRQLESRRDPPHPHGDRGRLG